jgi:hypothetical protein
MQSSRRHLVSLAVVSPLAFQYERAATSDGQSMCELIKCPGDSGLWEKGFFLRLSGDSSTIFHPDHRQLFVMLSFSFSNLYQEILIIVRAFADECKLFSHYSMGGQKQIFIIECSVNALS